MPSCRQFKICAARWDHDGSISAVAAGERHVITEQKDTAWLPRIQPVAIVLRRIPRDLCAWFGLFAFSQRCVGLIREDSWHPSGKKRERVQGLEDGRDGASSG